MDIQLFEHFIKNEGTFAILFLFMFLYFLRTSKAREKERTQELREFRKQIQEDIKLIHANTSFITTTYKLILEKELRRRKKSES